MAAGRPSKYEPRFCEEIIAFFNRDPLEGVVFTEKGAIAHGPIPPTLERFAHKIGVAHDTLHEWARKNPEFSAALREAKRLQRAFYAEALASGVYSGGGAQFVAKNETDMVDKQEIDHSTKGLPIGQQMLSPEAQEKIRQIYEEDMRAKVTGTPPVGDVSFPVEIEASEEN